MNLVVLFELLQIIQVVPPLVEELVVNADKPRGYQMLLSGLICGEREKSVSYRESITR